MSASSNDEVIRQWSSVPRAEIEAFGDEGDLARQYLLTPTILSLIGDVVGQRVLDAGCGQGYLARLLARRGAHVVGVEPALPFIGYAEERERSDPLGIVYIQADLSAFADRTYTFDLVVANMVFMDIPDDRSAMAACLAHIHPGGRLVFSISHPCFEESDGVYRRKGAIATQEYFAEYRIPQRWGDRIHRPLSHYLNLVIELGATISAVVEPQWNAAHAYVTPDAERHRHVPGFLVVRAFKS